jgi:hypothetical protein
LDLGLHDTDGDELVCAVENAVEHAGVAIVVKELVGEGGDGVGQDVEDEGAGEDVGLFGVLTLCGGGEVCGRRSKDTRSVTETSMRI